MKLRYIYSACTICETNKGRILSDPWFTDGAFYGSWHIYPPLPKDPISIIGKVDAIYISHLHPDHYDPVFLKNYLSIYPDTRLLIGDSKPGHLNRIMKQAGFNVEVITKTKVQDIEIEIFPNNSDSIHGPIDTAATYKNKDFLILNMNDNSFDIDQINSIKRGINNQKIDLAMLPYTGAMMFPQMYKFEKYDFQKEAISSQKKLGLDVFLKFIDEFKPNKTLPFAGKYWLGGSLRDRNHLRGVTDQLDAKLLNEDQVLVLSDGGDAYFDCKDSFVSDERKIFYDPKVVNEYLGSLPNIKYPWEKELNFEPDQFIPIVYLLDKAINNARTKVKVEKKINICIKLHGEDIFYTFNPADQFKLEIVKNVKTMYPRKEIFMDRRLFFGILTRLYHWNNAYIGSHYEVRRVPDQYDRDVIHFLNYLHI